MASTADSRAVVAGQVRALSKVASQLIDQARAKIIGTDFDALPEAERAAAYAEAEAMVSQAESVTSEASAYASRLA